MRNREKAMAALLSCSTHQEAAQKAGISERTMRDYLNDSDFAAEYQTLKKNAVSDAAKVLQVSLTTAVRCLVGIIESDMSSESARITASRTVLEYGIKLTELTDIMDRLDALEKAVQ